MNKQEQPHTVYKGLFPTNRIRHVRRAAALSQNVIVKVLKRGAEEIVDEIDQLTGLIKIDPETGVEMKAITGTPTGTTPVEIKRKDKEKDLVEFWGNLDTILRRATKRSKPKRIRRRPLNVSLRMHSRIKKNR